MIIVRLKGGLGNQMFQYAFGRKMSLVNKAELKLDKLIYDIDHYRSYGLGVFNIEEKFARPEEIEKVKNPLGLISKFWNKFDSRILRHFHEGFEPRFLKKRGGMYLDGYWQSYKYFDDQRETILNDFTLKIPLEQTHPELLDKINSTNSVSLAVRRTDYLLPTNLKGLGVCSANYYKQAIELIESKVSDPNFFVVCDDLDWVKENISFKGHPVEYVSEMRKNNTITDYQELVFLSKCKHNIIANSSFSWWPAWLNQNPEKIVIAPDVWFTNGSIKTDDIVLPSWIKLPRD